MHCYTPPQPEQPATSAKERRVMSRVVFVAVLVLGWLPIFVGLAVAIPVLGHATWHLYGKVVA